MKNTTEVMVVMDKSGSMITRQLDAIEGFNTFLKDQEKGEGDANLTLVLFDTTYNVLISGQPIEEVEPLTTKTYLPSGNTALVDALARAIIETDTRLSNLSEEDRPEKVICVVITDGKENSSIEHTKDQVKEMVKHQKEKYNWTFLYLGTDLNSFAEASDIGVDPLYAVSFANSSRGMRSAYALTSDAVSKVRRGGKDALINSDWKTKVEK